MAHQACSFCGCSDGIGLHQRRLPDKGAVCVHNTTWKPSCASENLLAWQDNLQNSSADCDTSIVAELIHFRLHTHLETPSCSG